MSSQPATPAPDQQPATYDDANREMSIKRLELFRDTFKAMKLCQQQLSQTYGSLKSVMKQHVAAEQSRRQDDKRRAELAQQLNILKENYYCTNSKRTNLENKYRALQRKYSELANQNQSLQQEAETARVVAVKQCVADTVSSERNEHLQDRIAELERENAEIYGILNDAAKTIDSLQQTTDDLGSECKEPVMPDSHSESQVFDNNPQNGSKRKLDSVPIERYCRRKVNAR